MGMSFNQRFEALGIDQRFVLRNELSTCGICFSLLDSGDRTLLTHAGANADMAGFLRTRFDDIVAYLSTARVVHVTSFLDDATPDVLMEILRAVKQESTETLLCVDPGHVWSVERTPSINAIIGMSDYLLLNYREFQALGGYRPSDSNDELARRILGAAEGDEAVVVVKRPTGIRFYRKQNGEVVGAFYGQEPLDEGQIQDSTAAGDVFAGLLIGLTSHQLEVELGVLLGMTLARHQLSYVGTQGHVQFGTVAKNFIRSLDDQRRRSALPSGVFISHGRSPAWRAVRDFIEKYFDLRVLAFESDSWAGLQVSEALTEYLERCSVAVCVLTAEDDVGDSVRQARQNVVHEVGLFQSRYGFDRSIVLVEEGCAFVPEAPEACILTFPHDNIDHTFYRLGELIRERCAPGS
jgi:sugar/nucleoside kinase (ribokinase family)